MTTASTVYGPHGRSRFRRESDRQGALSCESWLFLERPPPPPTITATTTYSTAIGMLPSCDSSPAFKASIKTAGGKRPHLTTQQNTARPLRRYSRPATPIMAVVYRNKYSSEDPMTGRNNSSQAAGHRSCRCNKSSRLQHHWHQPNTSSWSDKSTVTCEVEPHAIFGAAVASPSKNGNNTPPLFPLAEARRKMLLLRLEGDNPNLENPAGRIRR
jgi:hypothetical protein